MHVLAFLKNILKKRKNDLMSMVKLYEEFPAYSSVLLKQCNYLRTVIVTAAVHRGFGRQLLPERITNFLHLPALGRRQPPYIVFRLCGDLCFW